MSSLSELLNPAPADESSAEAAGTVSRSAPFPSNPYAASSGQNDAFHASGEAGRGPEAYGAKVDSLSTIPSQTLSSQHQVVTLDTRHTSTYTAHPGDPAVFSAQDASRRMSGGSPDRYHDPNSPDEQMLRRLSQSSSEHPRRNTMSKISDDPALKLAPLQVIPSQFSPVSEKQSATVELRRDATSGTLVGSDFAPSPTEPSQQLSAVTFPAYQPAVLTTSAAPTQHDTSTQIKRESIPTLTDTIPPFVPVVTVKHEQQNPNGGTAGSVTNTEDAPVEARGVKRPAPKSASKKGVAKKGPPAKKQKTEASDKNMKSKSGAKSRLKKGAAASLESSPAPHSVRAGSSVARSSASPEAQASSEDEEEGDEDMGDGDDELYCICRKPDTGTFMIGCDGGCDDWFHGKCVGIAEKDKNLIDRYMCPRCVAKGEKNGKEVVTTWKRMCRKPGCRMPARLAKKDEEPSKYCSDACGVEFFKEMMSRTRGASAASKDSKKSTRKKANLDAEDAGGDYGPRGSVLNKGELKALVTSVSTFEEFKRLGDGVLSPPATPSPTAVKNVGIEVLVDVYCNDYERERLASIEANKNELRNRHGLLKDQNKFINLLRQTAGRIAEAKGIKAKDLCGYDDRAQWDEATFAEWRASQEGQTALKSSILDIKSEEEGGDTGPCLKRKCAKHFDWSKLALETNRFETGENSERMRALERDERDIRERAGLRARQVKAGEIGGTVEKHGGVDGIESAAPDQHTEGDGRNSVVAAPAQEKHDGDASMQTEAMETGA